MESKGDIIFKERKRKVTTRIEWDLLNAVVVYGPLGDVLDPVLDLCNPGIHANAGTLTAVADNANLGEPNVW